MSHCASAEQSDKNNKILKFCICCLRKDQLSHYCFEKGSGLKSFAVFAVPT